VRYHRLQQLFIQLEQQFIVKLLIEFFVIKQFIELQLFKLEQLFELQ
jgi:hypothetical protein